MKLKIKAINIAMLSLPLIAASCQSDPEVGSLLYPVDNTVVVKGFIDNRSYFPKNEATSEVIQAGEGGKLTTSGDTISLFAEITNPTDKDLTFTLKAVPTTSEGLTALKGDAVSLKTAIVTIKQGEKISAKPFIFSINKESASLKALKNKEKAELVLSLESKDGLDIVQSASTFKWIISKKISNINSIGTLEGKQQIGFEKYDYLDPGYKQKSNILSDGDMSDSNCERFDLDNPNSYAQFNFHEPTEVSGLTLIVPEFSKMGYPEGTMPRVVQIKALVDNKWTDIGEAICPEIKKSPKGWDIVFFNKIKTTQINLTFTDNFSKGKYLYTVLSEVKFYK